MSDEPTTPEPEPEPEPETFGDKDPADAVDDEADDTQPTEDE